MLADELIEETCPHCGVLWVRGLCPACNHRNAEYESEEGGPFTASLCPACSFLGLPEASWGALSEVGVVCQRCRSHFFWPRSELLEYLRTQEKHWVPSSCPSCQRQFQAKQSEDFRALAEAARSLADAYALLRPRLKDPEKTTLRYMRTQQRAHWIVTTYGRYLSSDLVYRVQASLGQPHPGSPFDESVPSKRAILRLRQVTKELLGAVSVALEGRALREEEW